MLCSFFAVKYVHLPSIIDNSILVNMKKVLFFLSIAAVSLFASNASAQKPTREQMEAMIAMMPKIPTTSEVRIGHLDNGLTYFIRHNELPKGRAEFYLATNVGAIQEEYPSQDGLAHFLEHMCFNGTEHFPDKGILDYLRSIGAEFGRNINASTGFEETQYMLNNIPVERESVVDSCLMILCDYAHFVVNDPVEIDKERGVIIEERRQRRNASWRTMERSLPYYFGDTKMAGCTLIGLQEHLETFDAESLKSFYRKWYHPDMQALIVVGDVDVDRTEAKIKEVFSIIPKCENPTPKAHLTVPERPEPVVGIITDPETTNPSIEIIWSSEAAPEGINATVSGAVTNLIKGLVSQIMYERFSDITSKPDSPYLNGQFYITDLIYEDIEAVLGEVALRENNILGGFREFYTELVRMAKFGFTDDEYERAKAEILSRYESRAKKAETRRNAEFVRPIIAHFFDQEPLVEPQYEYEMIQQIFAQINVQVLNQVSSSLLAQGNPVIIYSGPEKEGVVTPSAADILSVIEQVNSSDIKPAEGEEIPASFLDPAALKGSKVKKQAKTIYGASSWTLKNGVRVIAYPTDYTKDQIRFSIYKDGGKSQISTEDLPSFDDNVFGLYLNNTGVSSFSGTVVSKMLSGKNLSVTPFVNDLDHGIRATSTQKDLETAFQLAYLFFTDPRFDEKEWNNGIDQIEAVLPNLLTQPNFKFQGQMLKTLYNDNPRRQMISMESLQKADLKVLEKNYRRLFNDAAGATVIIVGDFVETEIRPLVEKYIGSLPKGKKPLGWVNPHEEIVRGKVLNDFAVDMQTPKSTVLQLATAYTPYSAEKEAALDVISYILDMRYVNSLREEEGGTYGAHTAVSFSRRPEERVLIQVYFDCRPSVCDKLRSLAIEDMNDLAEGGPTAEEMNNAILNLKKNLPENRVNNNYWFGAIRNFVLYGEDEDRLREEAISSLTAEKVRDVLREVLAEENLIEVVMRPGVSSEKE